MMKRTKRNCERPPLGLSQLNCWADSQRTPLQDGDHSGNDPRLVPDFLLQCSGMLRNGSGERPYLRVPKESVQFRQSAKNAELCPAEFLGQFLNDSAFNLFRNLREILFVDSRNGRDAAIFRLLLNAGIH